MPSRAEKRRIRRARSVRKFLARGNPPKNEPKLSHIVSERIPETQETEVIHKAVTTTLPSDAQIIPGEVHTPSPKAVTLLIGHGGVTEKMVHSIIDGHGIFTIDELKQVPDEEILEWKQFGPGRLAKIKSALQIIEAQ